MIGNPSGWVAAAALLACTLGACGTPPLPAAPSSGAPPGSYGLLSERGYGGYGGYSGGYDRGGRGRGRWHAPRRSWWGSGQWYGTSERPDWWGTAKFADNLYIKVGEKYYPFYLQDELYYPDYSRPHNYNGHIFTRYEGFEQPEVGEPAISAEDAQVFS